MIYLDQSKRVRVRHILFKNHLGYVVGHYPDRRTMVVRWDDPKGFIASTIAIGLLVFRVPAIRETAP